MEEIKFETKERYRALLTEPIINQFRNIEFQFISRYAKDNKIYISDDDRNRGELKISDLTNGNIWNATYYLTFFPDDICHLTLKFDELLLKSTDLIGAYEANNISYRFDEMINYLEIEFPPLPQEKL